MESWLEKCCRRLFIPSVATLGQQSHEWQHLCTVYKAVQAVVKIAFVSLNLNCVVVMSGPTSFFWILPDLWFSVIIILSSMVIVIHEL